MFVASVAAVVGTLGASALATHAYASQNHAVLLAGLAAEIVVGHLIGAGALHAAHRLVRRALAVGPALGIGVATAAALAGPSLLGAFTSDASIWGWASSACGSPMPATNGFAAC